MTTLRASLLASSLALAACGAAVSPTLDGATAIDAGAQRDGTARADVIGTPDVASSCAPLAPSALRAPNVVRSAARAPVAATAASAGCGCEVSARATGAQRYELQACDCSVDPCVDPSYVSNWDDAANGVVAEPAAERITVGAMSTELWRLPLGYTCAGGRGSIASVTIEADNDARRSGPRRVWALVTGTVLRCSGEPLVLIETRGGSPIFLEPQDCNNFDCDGPTRPVPYRAWVMLGELAPGTHSIFYSPGISQTFEVR
jgi:hypothetical protein